MSAAPLRQPRPRPHSESARRAGEDHARRPHLRVVSAPEQARSLVPFAWMCALIVIAALSSVLLLNTSMARGAYERRDLKIEIADLHEQRAALMTTLEQKSSPTDLAYRARTLGMRPAKTIGFVSLDEKMVIESEGR